MGLPSGNLLHSELENCPFIEDLPMKNCEFPIVMLVYQSVIEWAVLPNILWGNLVLSQPATAG